VRAHEPDVIDTEKGRRPPCFYDPQLSQSGARFIANGIAAAVSVGAVDDCDPPFFDKAGPGKVSSDHDVVVGMRDNQQNVGFIPVVRLEQRRRLWKLGGGKRKACQGNYGLGFHNATA